MGETDLLRFRRNGGTAFMATVILAKISRSAIKLQTDQRGNVAVLTALLLPALMGAMGVGFEVSNWYVTKRSMQNAADAATIAAATNGASGYIAEAKAVAAQYGFVDGVGNVTVTATNTAACPSGGNTCYSVTIAGLVPLYVSPVIGFRGDASANNSPQKRLSATAVANVTAQDVPVCLLALGLTGAQDIVTNGNPKANFSGCSVMANTSSRCNGSNLNAPYGLAHGTNSGCGIIQVSGVPTVADPFSALASNIPANSCASYPQAPTKHGDPPLPAGNQWSGNQSLSGNVQVCGDLQLTADVVIDAPAGAVLVIENGQLDTNGYKITTSSGSGVTVVFSGTNGGSYIHAPTGGGTIDIAAPTSGPWSGVAMYQDPNLTTGVNISDAGNSPTWDITGLVYLPNASVRLSGAVNKSSNGQSCFVMVMNDVTINGTGDIAESGGCRPAGLTMPTATIPARPQLVQ
jgi:Flp pilus assembly protein TadG